MKAAKKAYRKDIDQGADRALKRAVAKVWREAARNGTKLAIWKDGAVRMVVPPLKKS